MKKVLFPVLVALVAIGCSKSDGGTEPAPETGTPIAFGSDYDSSKKDVRTTYDGAAPTTMLWSSYDNIGVYTFNASSAAIAKDNCTITPDSYGKAQGYFKPDNLKYVEQWIGENTGDIVFRSFYPVGQDAAPAYGSNGISVSVPELQSDGFGHYQICCATTETTSDELLADPNVTFAFKPVSSMVRLFFYLSEDSDLDEIVVKEASVTTNLTTGRLCGDCTLDIANNKLITASGSKAESKVTAVMTEAIKIGKLPASLKGKDSFTSADFATYVQSGGTPVDIVVLPILASDAAKVTFKAVTSSGLKLNSATIDAINGLAGGKYYNAMCPISVKVDSSTPDASYIDGGAAWGDEIQPDGSYMDGGTAW